MEIKVLNSQSLFDLAIQYAGAPEAAFDIAIENELSLTGELTTGQILAHESAKGGKHESAKGGKHESAKGGKHESAKVAEYYSNRRLFPATDITGEALEEGIEFWYVEYDFTVR